MSAKPTKTTSARTLSAYQHRPAVEKLEARNLPAVAFMKVSTLMFIAADNENNNVSVRVDGSNLVISDPANMSDFSVALTDVDSLMIQTTDGDDVVDLSGLPHRGYFVEIDGGTGNDLLIGSSSVDAIYGGEGNDTIFGGEGDDYIYGGGGNNQLNGGLGNDRYVIQDLVSDNAITDDGGSDTLDLSAISDMITVAYVEDFEIPETAVTKGSFETDDIEHVILGEGDDTVLFGNNATVANGTGTLNGAAGVNTLDYSRYNTAPEVDFANGTATGVGRIVNFDNVVSPNALPATVIPGDNSGPVNTITDPQVIAIQALRDYVQAADPAFRFELFSSSRETIPFLGSYTVYNVNMISQTWRTPQEVNRTEWQHMLTIVVPDQVVSSTALFLIDGGNNPSQPLSGSLLDILGFGALQTQSVVVRLPAVPNQPLFFTGDPNNSRTEDEILSYSFNQYLETGDPTWPVLEAMVKAAVKGMDVVQQFVPTVEAGRRIEDFVVTGASKRGWTTWLTSAVDERVVASIPIVIDVLNMQASIEHIISVYGFVPNALTPYRDLNVFSQFNRPIDKGLFRILDPINYVADVNDMPVFAINSAGDQFFITDAGQFYQNQIVPLGNFNVRYLPNTGHGLDLGALTDSGAVQSILSFFQAYINDVSIPNVQWELGNDGSIVATTNDPRLIQVNVWEATNEFSRDLRYEVLQVAQTPFTTEPWSITQTLAPNASGVYTANRPAPPTGATGYFLEFVFNSGITDLFGNTINFIYTTEARVASNDALYTTDFGDAPISYGEAGHIINDKTYLHLGILIDAEYEQQYSNDARGDDDQISGPQYPNSLGPYVANTPYNEYGLAGNVNGDDDGVEFVTTLQEGGVAQIDVTAASEGFLNAWIDFDGNGTFDAGEQIAIDLLLQKGTTSLMVAIPTGFNGDTFARFRLSDQVGIGPTGIVANGEVEDYMVTIQA